MAPYFEEFFRSLGREDLGERVRCVSRALTPGEFRPGAVYVNHSFRRPTDERLLRLYAPGLLGGEVHLPTVPVGDEADIVPAAFRGRGRTLAWLQAQTGDGARWPALVEFPDDRFVFNIDVYEAIDLIRRERYFIKKRPLYTYLPFNIQRIPPEARQVASALLRGRGGPKAPSPAVFPAYPKDGSVQALDALLRSCVSRLAGPAGLPRRSPWPGGKSYAFMLSHDVDSGWLYRDRNLDRFLNEERRYGVRGAWYVVGNLYAHDFAKLDRLAGEGHELGLHGDNHDHKIAFLSNDEMNRRLSPCRSLIDRYAMWGFRSPNYLRTPRLFRALRRYFRYDTSMHDSYNPTQRVGLIREGCSTTAPFRLFEGSDDMLELPVTVPEDYEFYDPAKGAASVVDPQWAQIEEVKRQGGLATLVIHTEPHFSARKDCFEAFSEILRRVAADPNCWIATGKEIAAHWARERVPA